MILTVICFVLLIFSVWYTPFRLMSLLGVQRIWPWQLLVLFIVGGYLSLLLSGVYTWADRIAAYAYNLLGLFFMFHVYLFFYLAVAHLLSFVFKGISGRAVPWTGVLVCLALVLWGFARAQSFTVTTHEVGIKGLVRPVSMMHISDLHLGAQRGEVYLQKIIDTIEVHAPDVVLYNGDLVDSNIALRPELFSLFEQVAAEQYYTTGNHEYYLDTDTALELIEGAGIHILRSKMVEIHGLQFIGMEYMNADRETYDSHMVNDLTIEEELPKIERSLDLPTVLAHHSPVGLQYLADGGIDAMISGHTHGGQLFPGNILTKIRFPMDKGRFQIGDTALLVSQGAGTFGPWMRLGTFNEIQLIKFVPAE